MAWNDKFPPLNLWNYNMVNTPVGLIPLNDTSKVMSVNSVQYGGNHYKSKAIQPWDYVAANNLGYFEGSIIKYVSRWKDKNGIEDLHKARHFLDKDRKSVV